MRSWVRLAKVVAAALIAGSCSSIANRADVRVEKVDQRPNFIFILGDDVGISDINAYSQRLAGAQEGEQFYQTPHLDQLAQDGVAFEQAYATQLCSPSRAALLTGRFAPRLGFTSAVPPTRTWHSAGLPTPPLEMPLDTIEQKTPVSIMVPLDGAHTQTALPTGHELDRGRDVETIAEALKGYRSVYLGKWHLGGHGTIGHAPRDNGFEELAWYDAGDSPYFDWRKAWQRTAPHFATSPHAMLELGNPGLEGREAYLTDDLTERAVSFIKEQRTADAPFFLYLAHFAVHTPMQASENEVDAFSKRGQIGWNGQRNATYAAMLAALDRSVGAIRAAVEANGLADNTYIVFMADNGGVDWQVGKGSKPLRIAPGEAYEGNPPPTSNAPFRGGKATLYEGGIRVPLLVLGPDATGGRWVQRVVDVTDIFPTLYQLAGFDPARLYKDASFDGRSLVSLLRGEPDAAYSKEAIYWHYPYNVVVPDPTDGIPGGPTSAIRHGRFKLIVRWHRDLQLFDVVADPFEQNDLANSYPIMRDRLFANLTYWLASNVEPQYFPQANPDYDPRQDPRGPARSLNGLLHEKEAVLLR